MRKWLKIYFRYVFDFTAVLQMTFALFKNGFKCYRFKFSQEKVIYINQKKD